MGERVRYSFLSPLGWQRIWTVRSNKGVNPPAEVAGPACVPCRAGDSHGIFNNSERAFRW